MAGAPPRGGGSTRATRQSRTPYRSGRFEVGDLGRPLVRLALEAPFDRHAGHERVADEAVAAFLGVPHGHDQKAPLSRPGGVVDLTFRQPVGGCATASVARYCSSVPPGQKCVSRYAMADLLPVCSPRATLKL